MKQLAASALTGMLVAAGIATSAGEGGAGRNQLMTHPEIYAALHAEDRTTVLVVDGGMQQRG
jgi:hypothetical protein